MLCAGRKSRAILHNQAQRDMLTQILDGRQSENPEDYAAFWRTYVFGCWRMGLGIYKFDESVYPSLIDTLVPDDLPTTVFMRLPEWCIYIDTPDFWPQKDDNSIFPSDRVLGFWVGNNYSDGYCELMIIPLFENRGEFQPIILKLDKNLTVAQSLQSVYHENIGYDPFQATMIKSAIRPFLGAALSLILWVCSDDPDISKLKDRQPMPHQYAPQPIKSKKGFRFCPPAAPTHYVLGARIGGEIRDGIEAHGKNSGGEDQRRRAHIRRAHWHGYWKGKRDGQQVFDVRWIPPILVSGK